MPDLSIATNLSDADAERIICGVVAAIKPLLDARPELVDGDTMSQKLGVSPASVDRLRRAGVIPSIKLGHRRLYRPDAVIAAIEADQGGGGDDA